MKYKFKVGDEVYYTSGRHGTSESNPVLVKGIITKIPINYYDYSHAGEYGKTNINVRWLNGNTNSYNHYDLTLVSITKNKNQLKLEEITNAICKNTGSSNLTVGKEYEVIQILPTQKEGRYLYVINDDNMKMIKVYSDRFKQPKPKTDVKKAQITLKTQKPPITEFFIPGIGRASGNSVWINHDTFQNISGGSDTSQTAESNNLAEETPRLPF